jgi:hypothetical protein
MRRRLLERLALRATLFVAISQLVAFAANGVVILGA